MGYMGITNVLPLTAGTNLQIVGNVISTTNDVNFVNVAASNSVTVESGGEKATLNYQGLILYDSLVALLLLNRNEVTLVDQGTSNTIQMVLAGSVRFLASDNNSGAVAIMDATTQQIFMGTGFDNTTIEPGLITSTEINARSNVTASDELIATNGVSFDSGTTIVNAITSDAIAVVTPTNIVTVQIDGNRYNILAELI